LTLADRGRGPGDELESVLAQPGCPTCRRESSLGRRWLESYGDEHHTDPEVAERVYRAGGFCPGHTREFASGPAASWALVRTALGAVSVRGGKVAAGAVDPGDGCPVCAESEAAALRWTTWLVSALGEPGSARRWKEHGGLCVDHVLSVGPVVPAAPAKVLVDAALEALGDEGRRRPAVLGGYDEDAERREAIRQERAGALLAAEEALVARTGLQRALAEAEPDGCPLCRSEARANWRYVGWLLAAGETQPATNEEFQACRSHLADIVARSDAPARGLVLAANAERLPGVLSGVLAGRRGRRGSGATLRQRCRICSVAETAVRRTSQLLAAAWSDPAGREGLSRSHGPCAQHARALVTGSPWRAVLAGRLAMVTWELEETVRRNSWSTRWEPGQARRGVAEAALALLDGRTALGLVATPATG
jgi:hypothetical protein